MAIPVSTTLITVLRPDGSADEYENDSGPEEMFTDVRAQISSPSGRGAEVGGQVSVSELRLQCDPIDLRHTDYVKDQSTEIVYSVNWVANRRGFGIDHIEAGLQRALGAA